MLRRSREYLKYPKRPRCLKHRKHQKLRGIGGQLFVRT
jgi:hypothetical protein